jgi:hypothetical protein
VRSCVIFLLFIYIYFIFKLITLIGGRIFLNSTGALSPSQILRLLKLRGEQVIVCSSEKEARMAVVESTHLEVDLVTNEGFQVGAASWYNVRKSSPLGTLSASRAVH